MRRNSRNSFEQKAKIKAEKGNNINIQINFNMKEKAKGITGKKIDNFVEIQQKNPTKLQIKAKNTQQQKKKQKKTIQTIDKSQKEKHFETPNKYKTFQRVKNPKTHINEQTPQKIIHQRRQERSKSANSKLVKRKNAKSGIKYVKNKRISPNNSSKKQSKSPSPIKSKSKSKSNQKSKSKSKQKSNKNLLKSHEASLKNLNFFSNSGIKNKIKKQFTNSKQKLMSSTKKPNHDEILKFMNQKKHKQKIEKTKRLKQQKIKKQKLAQELKKVQIQRKANASKKVSIAKIDNFGREQRLPIYYFDDEEEFNEESNYQNLNNQASKLIHDSPSPKQHIQTIQISRLQNHHKQNSGEKKIEKKKKTTLVQKYLKGTINQSQLKFLNKKIITIQSVWRGFLVRKAFAKKLSDQTIKIRYMRNKIQNKKGVFWNDQQNSIVHLQKDSPIKLSQSDNSQSNTSVFNKFHSNPHSHNSQSDYQSNSANKFKKLSIQLDDDLMRNKQKQKQEKDSQKMQKEIEQLKKMIEEQNNICKKLQIQNFHLKKNIKGNTILEVKNEELANSIDFMQIRMPKKIESPQQNNFPQGINIQFSSNSDEETHNKRKYDLNSYKQQFQQFQCSSPSNAKLQQQIKTLKHTNISGLFKKKQIKVEEKYVKKYEIFDKMLNDKIFSPRTYNMKKKQLQMKKKQEIQQIEKKKQQAKKVVGFFQDVIIEEESNKKEQNNGEGQNQEQQIRTASYGIIDHKENRIEISPPKIVKDSFTNTDPIDDIRQKLSQKKRKAEYERQNDSYSSEDEQIYRKYWTDDIQQVHKHTVQITKRIDQALKSQSQSLNSKNIDEQNYRSGSSAGCTYNNVSHEQKREQVKKIQFKGLNELVQNQSLIQLNKPRETEAQKKAREIFNKIDLYDDESKSEEQMQDSHDKIYELLNKPSGNAKNEIKQNQNLYISEAQFNKKRKSQDLSNSNDIVNVIQQKQLSRSSSFEKSKSFSANNSDAIMQGFITNLTFIKEFCISICQFIRSNQAEKTYFIQCLSKPSKIDLFQYLKSYRITIGGQIKNNYNTYYDEYLYNYFKLTAAKVSPITSDLFSKFMQTFQAEQQSNATVCKNKQVKSMREYFLISVIDCFNESLQYEKPGSVYGESIPWLNSSKKLKNHTHKKLQNINSQSHSSIVMNRQSDQQQMQTEEQKLLDQIFGTAIAKIIQWGSCLCGFIADPMPMEMGDSQIANLSQTQLCSIRQNRVGLMLQKWLVQQEQKITNSTGQYTQVVLNLSERIIQMIIDQVSEQFYELENN